MKLHKEDSQVDKISEGLTVAANSGVVPFNTDDRIKIAELKAKVDDMMRKVGATPSADTLY